MDSDLVCNPKKTKKEQNLWVLPQKSLDLQQVKRKKVIVISGPTAVGKTQLSLIIARAIGGEIISADSMQVYRGMDIGTAKPTLAERQATTHHLIDSRDLDETFNVMECYQEASLAIKEILDKKGVPIIVGGTGFYIHSLIYGPPPGPPSDPELRRRLEDEIDLMGTEVMYERLKHLDPQYAGSITVNDRHKIVRALEIITITSMRVSSFRQIKSDQEELYDYRCWFLYMSKETLYPRIEKRCDEMLAAGFLEEVQSLVLQGFKENSTASQAIGYKQCLEYLDSPRRESDWLQFVAHFKQASRRYAKRQFTWFRKEELFRWLNRDVLTLEQAAELIIQDYERG